MKSQLQQNIKTVVRRRSVKTVLLEISQNSQSQACNFNKKEALEDIFEGVEHIFTE